MKRFGFTLIEILVIIAILGIFLAVVVPLVVKKKPIGAVEQSRIADQKMLENHNEGLQKRFVQSGDISGPGRCTWHIKDAETGKEYLVISNGNALTTIDVTPANSQKKPEKD